MNYKIRDCRTQENAQRQTKETMNTKNEDKK